MSVLVYSTISTFSAISMIMSIAIVKTSLEMVATLLHRVHFDLLEIKEREYFQHCRQVAVTDEGKQPETVIRTIFRPFAMSICL